MLLRQLEISQYLLTSRHFVHASQKHQDLQTSFERLTTLLAVPVVAGSKVSLLPEVKRDCDSESTSTLPNSPELDHTVEVGENSPVGKMSMTCQLMFK